MRLVRLPDLLLLLGLAALPASARAADPDALWQIVHGKCAPHMARFGVPAPCLAVDLAGGAALLKDIVGATQLLLIPTARVSGTEDPAVLRPEAPDYFALAWRQTPFVRALADADLPDATLSLAINSRYARSQNQLHIHIDCLQPEVYAALQAHAGEVTAAWAPFPVPLQGRAYLARRVDTLDRPGETPFQLVADGIPGARADMGAVTLVVAATGTGPAAGFILLADRANLAIGDRGWGEALQDHACALARGH